MLPVSMTLNDLGPGFQGQHFLTLNILETTLDKAIVTKERQ